MNDISCTLPPDTRTLLEDFVANEATLFETHYQWCVDGVVRPGLKCSDEHQAHREQAVFEGAERAVALSLEEVPAQTLVELAKHTRELHDGLQGAIAQESDPAKIDKYEKARQQAKNVNDKIHELFRDNHCHVKVLVPRECVPFVPPPITSWI